MNPFPKEIDVIVPIFNEQDVLPELFRRLEAVAQKIPDKLMLTFIDDGSTDRSADMLQAYCLSNPRARVIQFSRNFGPQAAHRAGVEEGRGDAVIFIDGDLQDPPELLVEMIEKWKTGAEVVICQRRSRTEVGLRGLGFKVFHKLFSWITSDLIPPDSGIFGLLNRQAIDAIRACKERNLFLPGLRGWVGFKQEIVSYDRMDRGAGETKQSFFRLIRYAWNAIASFSTIPLKAILALGSVICALCLTYAGALIVIRVLQMLGWHDELKVPGFTTLAVATFFLGGVQLMSLGIVGQYLAKVYEECKARPSYIVKKRSP